MISRVDVGGHDGGALTHPEELAHGKRTSCDDERSEHCQTVPCGGCRRSRWARASLSPGALRRSYPSTTCRRTVSGSAPSNLNLAVTSVMRSWRPRIWRSSAVYG